MSILFGNFLLQGLLWANALLVAFVPPAAEERVSINRLIRQYLAVIGYIYICCARSTNLKEEKLH